MNPEQPTPYRSLYPGFANILVPPRMHSLLSGCIEARQNSEGAIRLLYEDGTEEIADCPEIDIAFTDNFFSVVDAVQSKREVSNES